MIHARKVQLEKEGSIRVAVNAGHANLPTRYSTTIYDLEKDRSLGALLTRPQLVELRDNINSILEVPVDTSNPSPSHMQWPLGPGEADTFLEYVLGFLIDVAYRDELDEFQLADLSRGDHPCAFPVGEIVRKMQIDIRNKRQKTRDEGQELLDSFTPEQRAALEAVGVRIPVKVKVAPKVPTRR
jgi:hypothetical protein